MGAWDKWMRVALEEARMAGQAGEIPIGAVVVREGAILSRAHNQTRRLADPTAHAEILALRRAARILSNYRLKDADLYVTLEPCPMCSGALIWARIRRVIFALPDPKAGAVFSRVSLLEPRLFNHSPDIVQGVGDSESRKLLQDFFAEKRPKKRVT